MSRQQQTGDSTSRVSHGARTGLGSKAPIKVTKMIKEPAARTKHTPSSYLFEMKQTTEEKLAGTREMYPPQIIQLLDIGTSSHQKDTNLDVDQALFQPFPSKVVFQQFEAHKTYMFPLLLRNLDKVARHVKITHEESPYFSLSCQKLAGSKVAPGMEITYQITFTPDEKKDYEHELVCVTEREKFVVPIQAIGARALLDFPDEINFTSAPVKHTSAKTVLVRNVGNKEARFSLETKQPFSVSPPTATLAVNACMQVSVEFVPKKVGDHNKDLMIHYNTGEEVCAQLYGSSVDVNVRLDRSSLILENTYLGLSSQRSVIIHNRSDVVVHYQWKAFASEMEENMKREIRAQQLAEEENLSKGTFFERCMHDPSIRDRLPILTRSLDLNRKKYLDEERFLYADKAITLDPIEGDIWPNSQAEVSVIFQPEEATAYSRMVYCDVTGRESRLPLKIRGEGIGPHCVFSFDTLDIQNVFVNSAHAYEIVLENKGDIEAVYSLEPSDSLFGPKFTFAPSSGVLHPGQLQGIQISFCSSELGDFDEEFQWTINGSPLPMRLRVMGVVIGPTFQFDATQVKFGTISYGFQASKEVTLTNTSEIPMTFHLRVPSSNEHPILRETSTPSSRSKEFEIVPHSGTLPPSFHQVIKLNFTPASVKAYSAVLVVDIDEVGKDIFSLPITAKSVVPSVQLLTPILDYGRCFLKHTYTENIEFLNDSELPVKYVMPPQVDKSTLCCSSPHPSGVIAPHSTLSVQLQIEAQVQGEIMASCLIDILGSTGPQLEVGIYCVGEGPVLNVTPDCLQWGVCPVLTPIIKTVLLSNESLIPAEFECTLAREKTIFTVEPISAVIPPEQFLELCVTALVDDCLKFSDKLTIVVSQGVSFTVSLSAEGRGTTIVSHPPLQPSVDLGPFFSNGPCQRQFTLTNRGRRLQALSWTTEGFSAAKLKKAEIERRARDMKDMAVKRSSNKVLEVKKPLFEVIPNKFVLEPYQSIVITLHGFSSLPQVVNERLICHAIIGKNPHKERIMTVDVLATFVAPLLEFSSQKLLFILHQPPGSKLIQHSQELDVRNVSPLPVTSVLLCEYPFSLIKAGVALSQMVLVLGSGEDSTITVLYDSTYCVDKHSRLEDTYLAVAYKEHPQKDRISLKSEVYFPNIDFEKKELDFGCILNDTETIQYITMTNNSPLEVKYSWSFLKRPPVQRVDPCQLDEGVDMQSECETDSLEDEESDSSESKTDGSDVDEEAHTTSDSIGSGSGDGSRLSVESAPLREPSVHIVGSQDEVDLGNTSPSQGGNEYEASSAPLGSPEASGNEGVADKDMDDETASSVGHSINSPALPDDRDGPRLEDSLIQSERDDRSTASKKKAKRQRQPWELLADPFTPLRIEQIFDILPLHGVLQPGQSQQVQFSFYGHSGVATEVTAACRVEGGPTYQLRLSGEASEVQYKFSHKQIELGKPLYDQTYTTEVVLYNSGKVGLDYCTLGVDDSNPLDLKPGCVSVSPLMGHIAALEEQTITIHYLPGVPSTFKKNLQIQVAHFEPDIITLQGESVFPRISFSNVSRDLSTVDDETLEEVKRNLDPVFNPPAVVQEDSCSDGEECYQLVVPQSELEAETERLLVSSFANNNPCLFNRTRGKTAKHRPELPDFHLDFGFVVYGMVVSRTLHLTNVGHCPVSFTTAHRQLQDSGFTVDLGDKIRALPPREKLEFTVTFDPAAIKCPKGKTTTVLPFNLIGGPSYSLRLTAEVTRPSMDLSSSHLDFGSVICGQCKVVTVRLNNPLSVRCEWTAVTDKPPKKIPRHIPLHVRRKMKEKPPPKFFEVEPSTGILLPGKKMDIKVIFMPSEELHYTEKVPFSIHQNQESDLYLHVEGIGSEPQLLFNPTLAEFEPVLPFSSGTESEVTVVNPMPYPVEFYSLEFDKQYLEEEEMLRWVKGYDNQGRLLLPPPTLGGTLPTEIISAYEKHQKPSLDLQNTQQADTDTLILPSEANIMGESTISVDHTQPPSQATLQLSDIPNAIRDTNTLHPSTFALVSNVELSVIESLSGLTQATGGSSYPDIEVSPATAAIARYIGIDISPEAAEAEKKRGVAIIVHGPPSSGRTTQAKSLGEAYCAPVLVLDDIITAAISSASTPAGCKAREYCIKEAENKSNELAEATSNLSAISKKQINAKEKEKEKEPEVPTLPEPATPFCVQTLEGTQYAVPEGTLMPTVLPEDLVLEILTDRLQHTDCYKGVIFDGVESYFTSSTLVSTALLLRSFCNRVHIYFVNLQIECDDIQERLKAIEEEKERQALELKQLLEEKEEEEKKKIEKLLQMDEDEYEALSVEKQRKIDQIRLQRKRETREQRKREKEEEELKEREHQEEEMRRLEEEKLKKKGRKDLSKQRPSNVVKPPAVSALLQHAAAGMAAQSRPGSSFSGSVPGQQSLGGVAMTASGASMMSGTESPGGTPKKKMLKKIPTRASAIMEDWYEGDAATPLEKKYRYYSNMFDGLKSVLEDWDRQKGVVRPKKQPEPEEQTHKTTPSRRGKGGKHKDGPSNDQRSATPVVEESREGLGVPLINIQADNSSEKVFENMFESGLPSSLSILQGLGLDPNGPPIPKPVTFQVYPLPLKRRNLDHVPQDRFCFVAASPDDPNAPKEEPPKPNPEPVEEPIQDHSDKDHPSASRMTKRTGSVRSMESSDSGGQRKSPQKVATRKRSSLKTTSPSPSQLTTAQEVPPVTSKTEIAKPTGPIKLVKFRWVVPAGGQTKIKLLFNSHDQGQFDQTLNFEITGTRRRTQLFCRGHCVVPTLCQEPRIVFPSRKKTKRKDEIVHKRFILTENAYYFGPLHCGKTRDRYKEGRYPENIETLLVSNTSLSVVDVTFCFQHDHNATTFILDPPTMTLESGESKTLTLWAYPKSPNTFKDALVCCIKHNPNPVVFNVVCDGVEPDLKVDRKSIEFKKVLLHRKQSTVLYLHNHTLLPVAWRLSGLETLGEEFSFSQEHGIVQPLSDFPLTVHFRASKQVNYTKKAFKIEISDVEQIMGLMHVESVQVVAEAYDVALDISFPRGTDGGLDFQCIRVCDEHKLTIHLKNKGKYDIAYNFLFEVTKGGIDYSKMFQVSPTHSSLYPGEKAQPVNVVFKCDKEFALMNVSILKCQVIDTHVGEQGEVIANIPIKVSARAVFSQCTISPIDDMNFGPMTIHTRKSATFTLENKGEFEFKYAITKKMSPEQQKMRAISMAAVAAKNRTKSREGRDSSARLSIVKPTAPAGKTRTDGPLRTEVIGGSQRLVLGMFTVNSAMGSIPAGNSQIVTVDCIADKPGKHEEALSIEISDRQKDSPPVTYRISGEVLAPEINTRDLTSIFEEHRICRQLGVLGQHQFHGEGCIGVYGEEERRFVFKSVIVGQSSKARFKISNPNKIPCDVLVTVKSPSTKQKGTNEAFEIEPSSKVAIPSHSHIYATVTFKPTAMQSYSSLLEAIPDGTKGKGLTFELQGEGNLPQVSIVRPTLHNAKGNPLLLFRKLLLNHSQALPVTLKNIGTIPAKVFLEMTSGSQAFSIDTTEHLTTNLEDLDSSCEPNTVPPPFSVFLDVNKTKDCMVVFEPHVIKKCRGEIYVRIQDNQFEKMTVQLVGEGFEDDVHIENVRGEVFDRKVEIEKVPEEVEASTENHLHFGSIAVSESRQVVFTLTNRSQKNTVKFQWPSLPSLNFTPSTGHIKPATSKDIAVVFKTLNKPQSFVAQKVSGKLYKISFSQPLSQIPDWDDRMKSVRWVNIPPPQTSLESSGADSVVPQSTLAKPALAPAKKKIIETDPEPACSIVDDSHRDLELLISAVADFAKYECPVEEIQFKDTLMYQSKVYSFPVKNVSLIPLTYEWVVTDDQGHPLTVEGEMNLFSITPSSGIIQPESEVSFTLRFSPLDVLNTQCLFRCNIPNLDSSLKPLQLPVKGRSLMPYCHFDLDQTSDYLTHRSGDRRGSAFGSSGAIDPASTRVIEFNSCGVGVKNIKRFEIINPTSSGYEFRWSDDSSLTYGAPFKCITLRGYVEGGKKYEIVFEYLPSSLETIESLWCFSIPSISLSHSFLLVGHTDEPSVNLDRAYVSFKAMLIGTKVKETVYLINNEPTAYRFSIVEKSCHCDGHAGQLVVEPMSGTIQPNTRLPVTISFTARHEQEFNFNLQCNIKHKPNPLVLNVKAKGYAINTSLSYTAPDGTEVSLPIAKDHKRVINFGSVPVNERALGQISVFNNGQYNMEYRWLLTEKCKMRVGGEHTELVCVSPNEGTVLPQDRARCELTFSPPVKMVLKGCDIQLQIINGPTLPITLRGISVEPQVEFSFEKHDFGPCFLHRTDMPARRHTLVITNKDRQDISVNCLFKKQPYLTVQFESRLLAPNEEALALFEFRPRETVSYCESVVFEINGLSRKVITIKGDGAQMKIELANPAHKVVNFGALRIGEVVKKELKLANHSPIPLSFRLSLLPSSSTHALQQEGVLCVSPTEEITVDANGGLSTVSITFSPNSRVPQFSEEVTLECLGVSQPLFVVTGSCHGLEITLDSEHVPFGPVVQHSQSSRRILMVNSGDIGARFRWEDRFAPDFTLSPLDGYISPGMQITFDLTFHPSELSHDIRYDKIPCHIEGSTEPIFLTLTGVCIEKIPVKEVLHFTTNVRSKETRHLTIHNKTNSQWLLRPLIEGEQWSGPETISVSPNQPQHYELTYHPLTMTTDMQKHQGSIFFPHPDGTGLLYNLQGTADAPKHSGAISQDIPCKTSHTELLPVENWLRRPQRFRVDVHMVRPEKLDRSVSLHGLDYIDVPAMGKRDYKLHFYSFKECSILAKVTFRNELSGEYLYFHMNFKSTPPGIMGTIDLSTSVRKSASHVITVTNPLPTPVTLSTNCNVPDISLPPTFIVGAQSEGQCMFEYLPLKVGETTGKLSLQSTDLGVYQYELHLKSTSPPPGKPVHFTTSLGTSQQQQVRFVSYARGRTEYVCKVDNSDFHVERNITVASGISGTEANIEVTFEPSHLGDTHATLTIASTSGGEYSIPLQGHCLAPKPQGPFTIKPGSSISIAFKNIFTQSTQFVFSVDNPAFIVKGGDNLKARKLYNLLVTYDAKQADPNVARTGKLTVTSQHSAKAGSRGKSAGGITWVYYLKGLPPA